MDLCEEVEALFHAMDYEKLMEVIHLPENQPKIQAFGMDLITRICECGLAFCPELDSLRVCQDVLMHVATTIRPKEALIGLLEQAEIFVHSESNKFASLLSPLQYVMLNLPKKREHSFSWVLSILNSHMKSRHKFPAKWKQNLIQDKDAFLMEEDPEIKDTLLTYKEFCNFYEPFVNQYRIEKERAYSSDNKDAIGSIHRQQVILRDHLVQLLGDPLLYFYLHRDTCCNNQEKSVASNDSPQPIKTDARIICERLMGFLHVIDQHPEYYYEWCSRKMYLERSKLKNKPIYCGDDDESDDTDSDEFIVDFSSVVNYHYLIFVQRLNINVVPLVLSPSYNFISTVRLMSSILNEEKVCPIPLIKCFSLSKVLLDTIDGDLPGIRLESELLEVTTIADFIESVAFHTVYSEVLEVRKQGLQLVKQMLWKFDPKGRYDFIRFVLNRIEHDGIKGFIITQLKDCVRIALDTGNEEMHDFFTNKMLVKQLRLTCRLKDGVTTDLMDNKEQIISALNLILYLLLRDRDNITGVSQVLPEIEQNLTEPLYRALELSRAHYQLKLKELEDPKALENQAKEQKRLAKNLDVMFKENVLPFEDMQVSLEEQKRTLYSAMGTFDIMNGILARVNEVCNSFKTSLKSS